MARWSKELCMLVMVFLIVTHACLFTTEVSATKTLRLATTTSLNDSGLLDYLKERFEKRNPDITLVWVSLGTGHAIDTARRGDVDMVLAHNRALEDLFIQESYGIHGVTIAYNEFVIVGPPRDPAKIKGERDVAGAMRKIAEAGGKEGAVFVSRGDRSGTHLRERELWDKAGVTPVGRWYLEAGAGMALTLRVANEKQAYTLVDTSTLTALSRELRLEVMVEGAPILLNLYRVIPVNPARFHATRYAEAGRFILFLVSPDGQSLIGNFTIGKTRVFKPAFGITESLGVEDGYERREVAYWGKKLSGSVSSAEGENFTFQGQGRNDILDGFMKAIGLILSFDSEILGITLLSLRVSTIAVVVGALLGIPLGGIIALRGFTGKPAITIIIHTLMGIPPVLVGLLIYLALSSTGPFGALQLIYTPEAMIAAQIVIVTPIVVGLTISALSSVDHRIRDTALSLGSSSWQLVWLTIREARISIISAIVVAFGRAISEVGAIMIVGGNIRHFTRALTTAIVVETSAGDFAMAIALGIILLVLGLLVNTFLTYFQIYKEAGVKIRSWLGIGG